MKNVSSLKANNTNSPKTPGGISKSLLTPCRRVGLSRNWRKNGPSPFISPLSSTSSASTEVIEEKRDTRKRKERLPEQNIELTPTSQEKTSDSETVEKTPSRSVEVPRRKKSKTLISSINTSEDDNGEHVDKTSCVDEILEEFKADKNVEVVSTPVRTKSKKSKKRKSPLKNNLKEAKLDNNSDIKECEENSPVLEQKNTKEAIYSIKEKSPNDLSKECIVVIQRKIFKNDENNKNDDIPQTKGKPSEINESDSDEEPLIQLQKQNSTNSKNLIIDDDDFIETKTTKTKPNKLKDTKSLKTKLQTKKTSKTKDKVIEQKQSQDCFDDDDDDDFDNKKTILIRKTYDKVPKPVKAKSTGSITQKDIDILKSRIEAKKKLLLAQYLNPETEELRALIKKWQKGCQNALMELLNLMKTKFPDKESMDHSEMLKTLKIPPSLVGYDSENDCFHSPDDASIILRQFNDI